MHSETDCHIIDVFIFYSERKIMSRVVDSDLHDKMCCGRTQQVARTGSTCVCSDSAPANDVLGECYHLL